MKKVMCLFLVLVFSFSMLFTETTFANTTYKTNALRVGVEEQLKEDFLKGLAGESYRLDCIDKCFLVFSLCNSSPLLCFIGWRLCISNCPQ